MVVKKQLETSRLQAFGMTKIYGLATSIEAADAILKAADVELAGSEKIDTGLMTVIIQGDVEAVRVATEAGTETASRVGECVSVHVTPGPHGSVDVVPPQAK